MFSPFQHIIAITISFTIELEIALLKGRFQIFNGVVAVGNFYFDAVEFLQKKLWPYIDSLYAEVDSMLEEADKIQGPGGSQYATRRARQMRDRGPQKKRVCSVLE